MKKRRIVTRVSLEPGIPSVATPGSAASIGSARPGDQPDDEEIYEICQESETGAPEISSEEEKVLEFRQIFSATVQQPAAEEVDQTRCQVT